MLRLVLRRRLATACLVVAMVFAVAGCGEDETGQTDTNDARTIDNDNEEEPDDNDNDDDPDDNDNDDDPDDNDDEDTCQTNQDCEDDQVCTRTEPGTEGTCAEPTDDQEDGTACNQPEECQSGLCYYGTCTSECDGVEDCLDGWLCRDEGDVGVCEPPTSCSADGDCDVAEDRCVVDRNGDIDITCRPPVGGGEIGESCSTDDECQAGLCFDGECSRPCDSPSDCGDGDEYRCSGEELGDGSVTPICTERPPEVCLSDDDCDGDDRCVATVDGDDVVFACGQPNDGGAEGGVDCTEDADCAQNLCEDGSCHAPCDDDDVCTDIPASGCTTSTVERNGAEGSVSTCEVPTYCGAPVDCQDDDTCYIVSEDDTVETICATPNDEERASGEPCLIDGQCASNYCHEGRFSDYCATPCTEDADCPDEVDGFPMECGQADIDHDGGSETVAVCQRQQPAPCSSNDDCEDDRACAVIVTEDDDGLETVCMPDNDGEEVGEPCDEDEDCLSRACNDAGFCSAPCSSHDDCHEYQACEEETFSKEGHDEEFDHCIELPADPCTSSEDCDYDVQACNLASFDQDDQLEGAYCGLTNADESSLGAGCTGAGDCESNFCWVSDDATTGECTVFCDESYQCGADQVCAEWGSDLGNCLGSCVHNEDCDGGNVCQYGVDTENDDIYQYCDHTVGDGQIGDDCSSRTDCETGTCLTVSTYSVTDQSCDYDYECDEDYECRCPPSDPDCNGDEVCVSEESTDEESMCTRLCDPAAGDADCDDGGDHELTRCSDDIVVSWDDGAESGQIAACSTELEE